MRRAGDDGKDGMGARRPGAAGVAEMTATATQDTVASRHRPRVNRSHRLSGRDITVSISYTTRSLALPCCAMADGPMAPSQSQGLCYPRIQLAARFPDL